MMVFSLVCHFEVLQLHNITRGKGGLKMTINSMTSFTASINVRKQRHN